MQTLLDDLAIKLIKERVKQMIKKNGYTTSDREDLEQEFALYLLDRLTKQKESLVDRQGFLRCVISRHAITLIRHREAEKRDHRREQSLSDKVKNEEGAIVELGETILEDHGFARLGVLPHKHQEDLERTLDVAAVLRRLPPDLRDFCERLQVHSVAEVARQLGVPRQTLQESVRKLRRHFEEAGLEGDLEK